MTTAPIQPQQEHYVAPGPGVPRGSFASRLGFALQFFLSIAIACAVLVYLYLEPKGDKRELEKNDVKRPASVVEVVGQRLIQVTPGTPFASKLNLATCKKQSIRWPVLKVTGNVVASLRSPDGKVKPTWQFHTPEVLTVYTDWQRAQFDIDFYRKQLEQIKKLSETRVEAQKKVVDRLKQTVKFGTDAAKDLALERTNLLQFDIQGKKDVYEAENAVRVAERQEANKSRELEQAGLDTVLLKAGNPDSDIVVAEIPERSLKLVRRGQMVEAIFFGISEQVFPGKINRISSVISPEQRSLRILFVIYDPKDQLRPGMYATINVGTDPRDAMVVPSESVIHNGRSEYALVATDKPDVWRVVDVQVGEPQQGEIEILNGLHPGEHLLGKGVILLKPTVVQSLTAPQATNTTALRTAP